MMAVKSVVVLLGNSVPQLGWEGLSFRPSEVTKRVSFGGLPGSACCGSGTKSFENDESSNSKPTKDEQRIAYQDELNVSKRLHKDFSSFPRPLTVSDFSVNPKDDSTLRIAFMGLPGSYSEDAALKAYPNCQPVPCDEYEDTFKAVELWLADKAVLPIENSTGGSIHRNYDLLLRHRLHIVGEVQLAVNLCLLALPGIRTEQLRRVISHPQALASSDNFLSKLGITQENVDDTAGAAQYVALEGLRDAGVVASARAAEIYGLNVLAERIQISPCMQRYHPKPNYPTSLSPESNHVIDNDDDTDNITRYLVLARDPIIPRVDKPFKTSIVFTLDEGPGILFKALAVFALREINLTKIESRPQRKRPLRVVDDSNTGKAKYFDYLFYIDFEASMAEPRAQNALEHLQEFAPFLRVLGCYAMDTTL